MTSRANSFWIFGLLLCLFPWTSRAQQVQDFSLKQCIDYALAHQSQVLSARIDEQSSHARNQQVTGLALPQISGDGSFTDNVVIQKQLIDASVFNPNVPKGTLIPFEFGVQYNVVGNITLRQTIFDGSVLVALQAKKTLEELAHKSVQQTERDVRVNVSKAYYNVLVTQKQMGLLDVNIQRLRSLMHDTKVMYANGFVEKLDLDRIQVQLNNLLTQKNQLNNMLLLGNELLKFQMGMPIQTPIALSDSLSIQDMEGALQDTAGFTYDRRIDYSLLESEKKANEYDLKRYKMAFLPTLNFIGVVGSNRSSTRFDYFNKNQFWYGYGYVGLNLSVPIFSGFQRKYQVDQARLAVAKSDVQLQGMQQAIDLQISQSRSTLENDLLTLHTQEQNMKLAEEVYNQTKAKYEQGVGSNTDVINAESDLKQAQTNYFQALYEAILARIDYQKALGTI